MKLLTEAVKKEIAPFFFSEHNGTYSALLQAGTYQMEVIDAFCEGGGYSWDAIADLYIREQLPQYADVLQHDSEADMFCLYCRDEQAILDFLTGIRAYCDDAGRFRDLLQRADYSNWD